MDGRRWECEIGCARERIGGRGEWVSKREKVGEREGGKGERE